MSAASTSSPAASGTSSPTSRTGRSRSGSASGPSPISLPTIPQKQPTSPSSPPVSVSSLTASLKTFSDLSLSQKQTTLQSAEFQQALGHARRASFTGTGGGGGGTAPSPINTSTTTPAKPITVPGLSDSPTLSAADTDLPTPSSSPIAITTSASHLAKPSPPAKKAPSLTGVQLDGVCEQAELMSPDEIESGPFSPSSATIPASPFSNGARWGWPSSAKSGAVSPPPPAVGALSNSAPLGRRASITGPAPSAQIGAPLGRVTSAGAPASSSTGGGKDGLGLFRRFSVGGFGSRPKPPSPPASTYNAPQVKAPEPMAGPASAPAGIEEPRGRKASSSGAKPKRKISPMGERMLRGF